jgi:hypothetical protein
MIKGGVPTDLICGKLFCDFASNLLAPFSLKFTHQNNMQSRHLNEYDILAAERADIVLDPTPSGQSEHHLGIVQKRMQKFSLLLCCPRQQRLNRITLEIDVPDNVVSST